MDFPKIKNRSDANFRVEIFIANKFSEFDFNGICSNDGLGVLGSNKDKGKNDALSNEVYRRVKRQKYTSTNSVSGMPVVECGLHAYGECTNCCLPVPPLVVDEGSFWFFIYVLL